MNSINQLASNSRLLISNKPSTAKHIINSCGRARETLMTNSCSAFTAIVIPDEKIEDFAGLESIDYFYSKRYLNYSEELGHCDDIYQGQHQVIELSSLKESDILFDLSQLDEKTNLENIKAFICSRKGALTIAGIVAVAGLSYLVLRLKEDTSIEVSKREVPDPSMPTENIAAMSAKIIVKTIKNLDYDSTLSAINECEPSNNSTNLEALIRFNNTTCVGEVLKEVFCPSSNSTLSETSSSPSSCTPSKPIWQSANTEKPNLMLKVSCDEFQTLVGVSVTKSECIESVRTERLKMPKIKESIKVSLANSALNKLNTDLQLPEMQDKMCVSLDELGIDIANIGGGQGIQIRPVECLPKFNASNLETQPIGIQNASIADAADAVKNACIKKVALISDGISSASQVTSSYKFNTDFSPISFNGTTAVNQQSCTNAADKLLSSLLRRCPHLDIIDVQATTSIQNNGQCASVLSGDNLVQSLDAVSKHGLNLANNTSSRNGFDTSNNGTGIDKPDTVIIFEPHEVGGYTGDVPLTQEIVTKLENQGISVYSYESSQGSWLRSVPNIKHTSSVTEMVAKPISIPESIARQSGDKTAVATGSGLTGVGLTGLGMGALYYLYRNKKRASTQQTEEVGSAEEAIPLESIEEDECEDCKITTTTNPDGSVSTRKVYFVPGSQDILDITRTVSKTGTIRQQLTQRFESTGKTHHIESEHTSGGLFSLKEFGYKEGKNQVCSSTTSRYQIQPLRRDDQEASALSESSPFLTSSKKEV